MCFHFVGPFQSLEKCSDKLSSGLDKIILSSNVDANFQHITPLERKILVPEYLLSLFLGPSITVSAPVLLQLLLLHYQSSFSFTITVPGNALL